MGAPIKPFVRKRAAFRCEYCHFPERLAELRFQLDHIRAGQHGGPTAPENLAWSCICCNKRKGPNLSAIDPKTGGTCRLFHPREDSWDEHFGWQGPRLVGLTPVGRATVNLLQCNHPDALLAREALLDEGISFT